MKDHKQFEQIPPSRPVCGGRVGPLARASELLSSILTPVCDSLVGEEECQSSEEMKRAVEDANKMLDESLGEQKEVVIFSQDVKALYPSMDVEDMVEVVKKAVQETPLSFANIDWREAGK